MKVLLIQIKIPAYRVKPFLNISKHISFTIGTNYESKLVQTEKYVNNVGGRVFYINRKCIKNIINNKYDKIVLPGPNFKIINIIFVHFLCLILKKELIYWTQGQNRNIISTLLSWSLWFTASKIFYYSNQIYSKQNLINSKKKYFIGNTTGNSLNNTKELKNFKNKSINYLFVGRLLKNKKIDILIRWFIKYSQPKDRLVIVGNGPIKYYLRNLAKNNSRIHFKDAVYGLDLKYYYLKSDVYITAGKVGLGVVESLENQTLVIFNKKQYHSPEVEVLNGYNSINFDFKSTIDINILLRIYNENKITNTIETLGYNLESFVQKFIEALKS